MDNVTYPVAELDGELVWARDLAACGQRPDTLTCVGCSSRVLLRAGDRKRPHFAHREQEACTAGETVLHRTACRVTAESLEAASRERRAYPVEVQCEACDAGRTGNLALKADLTTAIDEVLEDGVRPDVLVSAGGGALFVVEVVVTHAPEEGALAVFERHRLPVLIVRPTWEMLEEMREGLVASRHRPSSTEPGTYEMLGRCTMPRHVDDPVTTCQALCDAPAVHLTAEVSTVLCWSDWCKHAPVRVIDLYDHSTGRPRLLAASAPGVKPPGWLTSRYGVRLSVRYSKTAGTRYRMHSCGTCNAPQGDNFVYAGLGENAEPVITEAVTHVVVCEGGHWTDLGVQHWPPGSKARRPTAAATGTCGAGPGLADLDDEGGDLVSVQQVGGPDGLTLWEVARRMTGHDRM